MVKKGRKKVEFAFVHGSASFSQNNPIKFKKIRSWWSRFHHFSLLLLIKLSILLGKESTTLCLSQKFYETLNFICYSITKIKAREKMCRECVIALPTHYHAKWAEWLFCPFPSEQLRVATSLLHQQGCHILISNINIWMQSIIVNHAKDIKAKWIH